MPMGIVSNEEFHSEVANVVERPRETPQSATIVDINRGRGEGNVGVPDSLRKIIGDTAITDGRSEAMDLANRFGVSPSSVSAYSHGSRSTASYDETPNKSTIDGAKERISKRARTKLIKALNHITDDKLESAKVGEIAAVARSMAAVVKDMEPDTPTKDAGKNGPTFVFYSPIVRSEKDFDTLVVKEG